MKPKLYRQGDLLIRPVNKIPEGLTVADHRVLAELRRYRDAPHIELDFDAGMVK